MLRISGRQSQEGIRGAPSFCHWDKYIKEPVLMLKTNQEKKKRKHTGTMKEHKTGSLMCVGVK